MNVSIPQSDNAKVRAIKERYSLDLLSATVLERRGARSGEDLLYYLENDVIYHHSPFEAEDVPVAVDRIIDAIDEDERILVFGDRDVDGVTAAAIMVRSLRKLGAKDVSYRLPMGDEPYGLTADSVSEILEKGYTLVITVDCGISSISEIATLERSGVDVIVLDHHIAGDELPPAAAIFDPRVEGAGYPFPGLAGCAVSAKMAWALNFARTPLYGSECIVLHAEPRNGTVRINAVRLENLVEIDRITEEVMEGAFSPERSRLMDFLAVNLPIFVLDGDVEKKMLRRAFGSGVDISLVDIRERLEGVMPRAKGHSLFDLAMMSRAARYQDGDKEIETLLSLFRSLSIHSYPSLSTEYDEILELAAIGTVADLMPMRDENRMIVKRGLWMLSNKPLPSLVYLIARQNMTGKRINTRDISFYIAPVLNAAGRMGDPEAALKLLLTDDSALSVSLTDNLLDMNKARQKAEEDVLSLVHERAEKSLGESDGRFIIIDDDAIPRGLTGAIASKLSSEFMVPAIVMADVDGRVSGSMRCKDGLDAKAFLDELSSYFESYGGHSKAAGFSLSSEHKAAFLEALMLSVSDAGGQAAGERELSADAQIPEEYMTENLWRLSEMLEPFGQENGSLRLYIRNARIIDMLPTKGDRRMLRFTVNFGRYSWPAIWWHPHDRERYQKGSIVDIIFTPDTNYWKGQSKMQMVIEEMEAVDSIGS